LGIRSRSVDRLGVRVVTSTPLSRGKLKSRTVRHNCRSSEFFFRSSSSGCKHARVEILTTDTAIAASSCIPPSFTAADSITAIVTATLLLFAGDPAIVTGVQQLSLRLGFALVHIGGIIKNGRKLSAETSSNARVIETLHLSRVHASLLHDGRVRSEPSSVHKEAKVF